MGSQTLVVPTLVNSTDGGTVDWWQLVAHAAGVADGACRGSSSHLDGLFSIGLSSFNDADGTVI